MCRFLLLALLSIWSVSAMSDTIRFAIGEWAPYTSANKDNGKIMEAIIREALAEEGFDVEFDYYLWARAYSLVLTGEYDGTFPWYSTEKRQQEVLLNELPIIYEEEVLFHLKSKPIKWVTVKDLGQYHVGSMAGYSHVDLFNAAGVKTLSVLDEETSFKNLLHGRIDVFPASKLVGYSLLNKAFTKDEAERIAYHPRPLNETGMFLLFSKKVDASPAYIHAVDNGLEKLRMAGRIKAIIDAHLNP